MKTANFPIVEFQEITRLNPHWSSWICFCETIKGRDSLSQKTVKRYFDKLIDKDDYAQNEKYQLLAYLYSLTTNLAADKN